MKTFKKQLMACILTLAMAVCTFATVTPANAATPTARQYLTKMGKAMKKAKSYEMKQTSKTTGSLMGKSLKTTQTQKQIYFKKPLKIKTITTSKSSGTTEKTVTYTKKLRMVTIILISSRMVIPIRRWRFRISVHSSFAGMQTALPLLKL